MTPFPPVAVVVLTYNEEANLPGCLESVRDWMKEIYVVDSGSGDQTQKVAVRYGARVVEHPFENHIKQWDWALQHLPFATEWVLGLDADQQVSLELKEEMIRLFDQGEERLRQIEGIYLKRKQIFRGQWIHYGGYYPKYLLKLFRRNRVQIDREDLIDHHFYVTGKVLKLKGDLIEKNLKEKDLDFWIQKHHHYAYLQAEEELGRRRNGKNEPLRPSPFGSPDQQTLWQKRIWYHLPLYVRPFLYFCYRYFLQLGFLDGKQGFIFHFLHAFWFRLLVDIYIDEREKKS